MAGVNLSILIRPSRTIAACLFGLYAAAGAICLLTLPGAMGATICVVLALFAFTHLRRFGTLTHPQSIRKLQLRDGQTAVFAATGEPVKCELMKSTFVSPWLTVINLRPNGRRLATHVLLTWDNVDAEDFRRLRIWLKWGARAAGDASGDMPGS